MSNSLRFRSNLRAAEKRRKRRSANQTSNPSGAARVDSEDSRSRVDVAEMMVEVLLDESQRNSGLRDWAVIAALRAISNGTLPRLPEANGLVKQMQQKLDGYELSSREIGKACSDLLEMAKAHEDALAPDHFIRYLRLLANKG